MKSLSTTPFILKIQNGQRFLTADQGVQNMLVVKSKLLTIAPRIQKPILLYAMCTQKQNSGPSENERYRLGPMAE